jgi:hypothetical protein
MVMQHNRLSHKCKHQVNFNVWIIDEFAKSIMALFLYRSFGYNLKGPLYVP